MAVGNAIVKWSVLQRTVDQIKERFVLNTTYEEKVEEIEGNVADCLKNDDFETTPIDWEHELE